MRSLFALVATTAIVASCNMAPKYARPVPPVPPKWPTGDAYARATGAEAAGLPWRRLIHDPKLTALIERALVNNRDLRAAVANVASAHAQYRVQRSDRIPTLTAGAEAGVTQSDLGGAADVTETYRADLGIAGFELDLFGRQKNLTQAQFEEYLASEAGARSTRISLIAETATAYAAYAASLELLRVARDTMSSAERSLAVAKRLNSAGLSSKLAVRQAETVVAQARSDVARFRTQIAQDKNALVLLVGSPVPDSLLPASLESLESGVSQVPAGLSSDVLLLRPDVVAAEHQLKAAYADIGAARAALFPRITLTSAVGIASGALSALFTGNFWTLASRATAPIFGSGKRAGVDVSKAQRQLFLARYEAAIQGAFREVADALARAGTIDDQLEAQRSLVEAAEKSYTIAESRFRTGIESYLNALDAQRTYYGAQQSAIATRLEAIDNRITLYRVIGNDPSTASPRVAEKLERQRRRRAAAAPRATRRVTPRRAGGGPKARRARRARRRARGRPDA